MAQFKGVTKEMAEERKGEPARKAGKSPGPHGASFTQMRFKSKSAPLKLKKVEKYKKYEKIEGKGEKVERSMKKGYRKGYRVPKRPAGRSSSRKSSGR